MGFFEEVQRAARDRMLIGIIRENDDFFVIEAELREVARADEMLLDGSPATTISQGAVVPARRTRAVRTVR